MERGGGGSGPSPASTSSRPRLQVLAQQVLAMQETAATTSAVGDDSVRPAPGGGKGTLTIVDNRTGKKYTVRMDERREQSGGGVPEANRDKVGGSPARRRRAVGRAPRRLVARNDN